jgi:hypothetical protein
MVPIFLSFSLSCLLGAYTDIPLEGFLYGGLSLCLSYLSFRFHFEWLDHTSSRYQMVSPFI